MGGLWLHLQVVPLGRDFADQLFADIVCVLAEVEIRLKAGHVRAVLAVRRRLHDRARKIAHRLGSECKYLVSIELYFAGEFIGVAVIKSCLVAACFKVRKQVADIVLGFIVSNTHALMIAHERSAGFFSMCKNRKELQGAQSMLAAALSIVLVGLFEVAEVVA